MMTGTRNDVIEMSIGLHTETDGQERAIDLSDQIRVRRMQHLCKELRASPCSAFSTLDETKADIVRWTWQERPHSEADAAGAPI